MDNSQNPNTPLTPDSGITVPGPNPTIGRIVILKLSAQQAEGINRRRTNGASIAARMKEEKWPEGAQAHIGNVAFEGAEYPMIVVSVFEGSCINGQVILDGSDTYWATSVYPGDSFGAWHWPVRV